MPQPVPAHSRLSDLFTRQLTLSIDEIAPVERCPRIRAKHQSIGIHSGWLARRENLDGLCPQGKRPLAALTLWLIEMTFADGLCHTKSTAFEINVAPAQSQFADP